MGLQSDGNRHFNTMAAPPWGEHNSQPWLGGCTAAPSPLPPSHARREDEHGYSLFIKAYILGRDHRTYTVSNTERRGGYHWPP